MLPIRSKPVPGVRSRWLVAGFALLSALLSVSPLFAADKWVSIQSKNFLLVGNAGESDIRRVGRTLEEFRSAGAMVLPKIGQTSSVPVTVVVFKNDESFKLFKPLSKGQP